MAFCYGVLCRLKYIIGIALDDLVLKMKVFVMVSCRLKCIIETVLDDLD